jgi:hypothetical protein
MKTLQSTHTNSPVLLSQKEMENPHLVLEEFHDYYQLNSIRNSLSDLLQVALTSDCQTYDSGHKRDNLLHLHHQVLKLVEATNLLRAKGILESN